MDQTISRVEMYYLTYDPLHMQLTALKFFDKEDLEFLAVGRVEETHNMKAFKLCPEERIIGLIARGLGDGKLMDV
jgi:hypothetical protein